MTYRAPLDDILFAARLAAGASAFEAGGLFADLGDGLLEATLTEAGKFAEERLASCYRLGDREGARFDGDAVTTPPGWKEAYADWVKGGWSALKADPRYGGLGLPRLLNAACTEIWQAANPAFAICPLLSQSAMEALEYAANEELKTRFLTKMASGEWGATINLTEPQAGSDLALIRAKAEPHADGSYRLFGQKIYITYGEHDLTENIVHLVLARLPGAPPGTQGISLFLAPKLLADADGRLARRNDLRCTGIEHKLGIKGSPTCTMAFGDAEGAVAYLVGEPNKGLATMFAMMNDARLAIGLQGVGIAERATQQALSYARERRQGRAPNGEEPAPILAHPDVKRMALTMMALTHAARAICYETAASIDRAHRDGDPGRASEAQARADLLTPVAKAFSTDIGVEAASLGVQIFGGIGYIEETGAAKSMRDARIAPIYEGTNGIQAIDLALRKLQRTGGALPREIDDMRAAATGARLDGAQAFAEAVDDFERASDFMLKAPAPTALAGATPYLRLFALARGGTLLVKSAAEGDARRAAIARFFARSLAVASSGLARDVIEGGGATLEAEAVFEG